MNLLREPYEMMFRKVSHPSRIEEIAKNRTTLYDPDVVDACLGLFNEKGYKIEG
jgi:hypothetical protein